tara:strand:- start:1768 stop:2166 length:399 start_codon:yes stop_codon:yes gene_type:complete
MDKIDPNRAVQKAQQQQTSSQTSIGRKTVINRLFATIKVAYPNFLNNQDESTAKRMWMAHMNEYSDDLIERAAREMVNRYPTFAPTIGEFKKLIGELNVPRPELQNYKALPAPAAKQSVAGEHLAKMRQLLK